MTRTRRAPLVLCLSGHDPTGCAGIQADIETCAALGAHALSIITAHTVQDTQDVRRVSAVAPIVIGAQLETLLGDCTPSAVKIGLLGDAAQVPVIAQAVRGMPLVIDPVLRAGGGKELMAAELRAAMIETLLPLAEIVTPNAQEARRLAGRDDLVEAGKALLGLGPRNVLITGGDEPGDQVIDLLFAQDGHVERLVTPRIDGAFHGAGCTLAAAIAALLAQDRGLVAAVTEARSFVAGALRAAVAVGGGRAVPRRRRPP